MTVKIGINMMGVESLYQGDPRAQLKAAMIADRCGIDLVSVSDHLLVSRSAVEEGKYLGGVNFPYGHFDWQEPAVSLGAIAAVTTRVRLTTAIMVGPLRSPALLAKQLATIDALSGGRLEVALGAGWMEEEFAASGMTFNGRFGFLEEQVVVCRKLWSDASWVRHEGKHVSFTDVFAKPRPVQKSGIPVLLGLLPSERNIDRLARVADGWASPPLAPAAFGEAWGKLKQALTALGRDASVFQARVPCYAPPRADGNPDLDALIGAGRAYIDAGATVLDVPLSLLCRDAADIEPLMQLLLTLKHYAPAPTEPLQMGA
ncbi:MAG: fmn-dependent monooxygenase [Nevskia sp.]|nr:fmn-dependent monooxygenase [Nevskia sp.]